jgi:hypothetical protein
MLQEEDERKSDGGLYPANPVAYRYRMSRRIFGNCRDPKRLDADRSIRPCLHRPAIPPQRITGENGVLQQVIGSADPLVKAGAAVVIRILVELLQLHVLRLGFFQDGDVRIGVFPEGEEILVRGAGVGRVALHTIGAGQAQAG